MRITNLSSVDIECRLNDKSVNIKPMSSFVSNTWFDIIMFSPGEKSYSVLEASKSKILKVLSFFDDPFKLIRTYYLVVNSMFLNERICNSRQINISVETCCVDAEARIYYNYVKLEADGHPITPAKVHVLTSEEIFKDFSLNNIKLFKWQSVWDVFIEPIVLEMIGYYAIYRFFSIWSAKGALIFVLFLMAVSILFELLMLMLKRNKYKKRIAKFQEYFSKETIFYYCYKFFANIL